MPFLAEIKRRKVFQVAALYAVMAWLIVQVIDVINDPLKLPDWLDTVVIVLLAVGLPIALVLAWAFDLTPAGIKPEADARAAEPASQLPGQSLALVLQALVLLAVAFLIFDQYLFSSRESSSPDTERIRRFALDLPWQNMTNWGDFRVRISPQGLTSPIREATRTGPRSICARSTGWIRQHWSDRERIHGGLPFPRTVNGWPFSITTDDFR